MEPDILTLRARQQRNLLATLLLSQGTPMLLAGDEFGRTQQGNNNAYCQDNEISWTNWAGIDARGESLIAFVQHLTHLRATLPVLRRSRFFTGEWNEELQVKDVTWLTPEATEMTAEHWNDDKALCLGVLLDGRAQTSGILRRGSDETVLMVLNAWHDAVEFKLPECDPGARWERLVDTTLETQKPESFDCGVNYLVTGRSTLLFLMKADA